MKYLPVPLAGAGCGGADAPDGRSAEIRSARTDVLARRDRDAITPADAHLYHLPLSPFSRKVRLVLSEKRLPFELRLEKVWERRPEYLELNPGRHRADAGRG